MAWAAPQSRAPGDVPAAWKDATSLFKTAAGQMGSAGFVLAPGTTLKDCMNATELLDPKLDAGIHLSAHEPVSKQLEEGTLSLDVGEGGVTAVADCLLRALVSA